MPVGALETVRSFLLGMGKSHDEDVANYRRYLADDVEWHTGSRLCHGIDDALDQLRTAVEVYGMSAWRARILHEAENGDVVLNERVDTLLDADGSDIADTTVAACFTVDNGKIVRWYDYYDTATLKPIIEAQLEKRARAGGQ